MPSHSWIVGRVQRFRTSSCGGGYKGVSVVGHDFLPEFKGRTLSRCQPPASDPHSTRADRIHRRLVGQRECRQRALLIQEIPSADLRRSSVGRHTQCMGGAWVERSVRATANLENMGGGERAPCAVERGRKGSKIGGPVRRDRVSQVDRPETARKSVQKSVRKSVRKSARARWARWAHRRPTR